MAATRRGCARTIVPMNRTRKTAEATATGIRSGVPLGRKMDIYDGEYSDLEAHKLY
jgi:L-lactate dehydrogenase